jgi:hypothetical protein
MAPVFSINQDAGHGQVRQNGLILASGCPHPNSQMIYGDGRLYLYQ